MDRLLWLKVVRNGECYEYGRYQTKQGYGVVKRQGRTIGAHRWVFYLFTGLWPEAVTHSCDNPPCVRRSHLSAGTRASNNKEKMERGRHPQANRTHCVHGHEFTIENTYRTSKGHRTCRTCIREVYGKLK